MEPAFVDKALYPFRSRWWTSGDGRQHYVDEGRGRPLVFVHGTPSWSFEWRHAIAGLRGVARCVALDHLGFGLSDKPADAGYRPADHARRLAAFVEELGLEDVLLVVHDFGVPIGIPLALEGGRVTGLVVLDGWMWPHGGRKDIARMSPLVRSWLGRLLYLRLNASPRWLLPYAFADRSRLTAEVHRHYLAPFPTPASRIAPWTLGCELAGSDDYYASLWARREALARLPSSIVWGMRDPAFGLDYLARWKETLPDAEVTELPVGHFPQEEAPEDVTRAIGRAVARGRAR